MSPRMPRAYLLAVVAVACSVVACSQPAQTTVTARDAAPPPPSGPVGRIRGSVSLKGSLPEAKSDPILKDQNVCGSTAPLTRISLGKDNTVRQAFVYLEGVTAVGAAKPRASTQIEQKGCAYGPHVMTFSPGTDLEIINNDPILHNVHARASTPDGLQTVFNIAQPVKGQRTKVETPLDKPGIVTLTCEAGHPWMSAYILVANHPYVATTSDDGGFVIENVPAGTYPIKMWHEGVRLTRIIPSLQQYEYETPYELTQDVVVPANGEVTVNFALELRKQS